MAGVVEVEDAPDSKSGGTRYCAGSSPASGTKNAVTPEKGNQLSLRDDSTKFFLNIDWARYVFFYQSDALVSCKG